MTERAKQTFHQTKTWVLTLLFVVAIIVFFIINSALAVAFLLLYTVWSIMKLFYRRWQRRVQNKK